MGEESDLVIKLDGQEFDPADYIATIAVPSTLSVKQTEDLLSDYKGQLIYGQRETGGQKIQLLTVPFRGSKQIVLKTAGVQKGSSEGYVLVRHVSNPNIISAVKINTVSVQ